MYVYIWLDLALKCFFEANEFLVFNVFLGSISDPPRKYIYEIFMKEYGTIF